MQTLNSSPLTTAFGSYPNASLDSTPSITVFAPASAALLAALGTNSTLSASQANALVNAHTIVNTVAYSPLLIDGARFKTADGGYLAISASADGTILVNGASKIIKADSIIANGVVHIIDKVRGEFHTSYHATEPTSLTQHHIYSPYSSQPGLL